MSLFEDASTDTPSANAAGTPLAERMRPASFDEFMGQQDILAPGRPLREAIEHDRLRSIILWGLPAQAKTTLRQIDCEGNAAIRRFPARCARPQGDQEVWRSPSTRAADESPDDRLCRRDPQVQQIPAGCVPSTGRGGRHCPHRRDDRESVVRGERRAPVALEGLHPARLEGRRDRRHPRSRLARQGTRPRPRADRGRRGGAANHRPVLEWRCTGCAEPARADDRGRASRGMDRRAAELEPAQQVQRRALL